MQRYAAANVGDTIIEHAVIGLIPGERAESAERKPVPNPVVCAQRKYFIHICSIARIIVAYDELKRGIE